jgi:hypothetical protein
MLDPLLQFLSLGFLTFPRVSPNMTLLPHDDIVDSKYKFVNGGEDELDRGIFSVIVVEYRDLGNEDCE